MCGTGAVDYTGVGRVTLRVRRSAHPRIVAGCWLYAGGMLAWQAARLTPVGRWWPFELADVFGVWLYAAWPILWLAAIAARSRRALGALLVPLLVFTWDYGELLVPRAAPEGDVALRVMTANLLFENSDLASLVAALREHRPDVVAFQELGRPIAEGLVADLGADYPYRALYPEDTPLGTGILSRHPLRVAPAPSMGRDPCFCQQVSIDLGGRTVTVVNVHPRPPEIEYGRLGRFPIPVWFRAGEQEPALQAALERGRSAGEPLLMIGDFNVSDRQPTYRFVREQLHDTYREAGPGLGYTFPVAEFEDAPAVPLIRVDYVFHDDAWAARAARTYALPGSDHRFLVADLVLRR